jgi:hypothetical protein
LVEEKYTNLRAFSRTIMSFRTAHIYVWTVSFRWNTINKKFGQG